MVGPLLHPIVGDAAEIHRLAADLEGGEIADLGEAAGVLLGQRGENVARDELARRGEALRGEGRVHLVEHPVVRHRGDLAVGRKGDLAAHRHPDMGMGEGCGRGEASGERAASRVRPIQAAPIGKLRRRAPSPARGRRGRASSGRRSCRFPSERHPSTPSFPESPCRRAGGASLARKLRRQRGRPAWFSLSLGNARILTRWRVAYGQKRSASSPSLSSRGCGWLERAERPAWRTQAENLCLSRGLVKPSAYVEPQPRNRRPRHLRPDPPVQGFGARRRDGERRQDGDDRIAR